MRVGAGYKLLGVGPRSPHVPSFGAQAQARCAAGGAEGLRPEMQPNLVPRRCMAPAVCCRRAEGNAGRRGEQSAALRAGHGDCGVPGPRWLMVPPDPTRSLRRGHQRGRLRGASTRNT